MTSTATKIQAASNGTTSANGTGIKDPVADLRHKEAQGLISLACDVVSAISDLAHEIHTAIYKPDGTPAAESQRKLLAAFTCMETAEHYLRMLDDVLADVHDPDAADEAGPGWENDGEPPF